MGPTYAGYWAVSIAQDWCNDRRCDYQALFFDVMALKADQHCSMFLLPQGGQPLSTKRTLFGAAGALAAFLSSWHRLQTALPGTLPLLLCSLRIGVESNYPEQFSQGAALMETLNAPDTTRGEMTRIGKSIVIKGELSCSEDLYIDGQVEGTIDPKGNRLIIGPNGSIKANVSARAVIVQGKLEGTIHASDRVDLKQSAIVVGDITTQRISIEEGAHLKGSVNIQKEALQSKGSDQ